MRTRLILAAALAALGPAAVPALADHPAIAPAHTARTHTVRMGDYFYKPKRITIRAGDRVRFVNRGKIQHTVADSTKGGRIRSRVIKPRPLKRGASQTVRFAHRGTVHYLCTFHPDLMRGVIVVR